MGISRTAYRRYKVIDSALRNTMRPYPTMADIQEACMEKLDVFPSEETIQKDFRNMREPEPDGFDAPIAYCRKNKGYQYTNPVFTLNAVGLNDNDILSIKEAIDLLQSIGSSRVSQGFNQALEKILSTYKEEFPESNSKRKIIQTEYIANSRGFEHFDILFEACKNKIPISFVHYSYEKRKFKSIIVHPVLLKEFDSKWYLVGYSENHECLRTFGFDRIYEPVLIKRKFELQNQLLIDNYFSNMFGIYPIPEEKIQTIEIMTTPMITIYLEAYPIHPSQKGKKMGDGSCQFIYELVPTEELIRLFRSYGRNLTVITPLWLSDYVKQV